MDHKNSRINTVLNVAICPAGCGKKKSNAIAIAGGGTGGHLFPGISIAREFMSRDPDNKVLFISTGNPFEVKALSDAGYPLKKIKSAGIKGMGLWNQLKSVLIIPWGIMKAINILWVFKPGLVLGIGSYAAGPVVMGAFVMRKKIALHEQNILPGITNRILSFFADKIYVSFKNTKPDFNPSKVLFTGNPIRQEMLDNTVNTVKDDSGPGPFTIFITGGSQGANSINMSLIDALSNLKKTIRFFFIHQTGTNDEQKVKKAYKSQGISCDVKPFFSDMAKQIKKADMLICRAGATTIAEITAIGKAVIFIPFPFAADNHQVINAQNLSEKRAAKTILEKDLNGRLLAERIMYYESNQKALDDMASKAKSYGKPDAAKIIVDDIYRLLGS